MRLSGTQVNKKAVESLIKAGAFDQMSGNRAQKLCVYEMAMDAASKQAGQISAGQMSLFDDESLSQDLPEDLPDLEDFPLRERLAMEKEFTGIYLSGHPLDEYREQLGKLTFSTALLSEEGDEDAQAGDLDGRRVEMGGLIAQKTSRATKAGMLMGILTLEDLYGSIEVLVFPKVFESIGHSLNEGDAVVMRGRLSGRDGRAPSLILESFRPLSTDAQAAKNAPQEKPAQAHKLFLRLSRAQLDAVRFILETTPGTVRVNYYFTEEGKNYVAPASEWVSEDFDREGLTQLLGEGSVVFK